MTDIEIKNAIRTINAKLEEALEREKETKGTEDTVIWHMVANDYKCAIEALNEIQQYQLIGTVEECRKARENQRVKYIIHNPDGGIDEDWPCPSCGRFCNPYFKHCQHCGQSIKMGDA